MNLFDFLHSPSCQCLALALLHFLWQGFFIALATVSLTSVLGRKSSRVRYGISMGGLVVMALTVAGTYCVVDPVIPTTMSSFLAIQNSSTPLEASPLPPSGSTAPSSTQTITHPQPVLQPIRVAPYNIMPRFDLQHWVPFGVAVYLLGVGLMTLRLILGLCGGQRLRRQSTPVEDTTLLVALKRQVDLLGVKIQPLLLYCTKVTVPTVVGVIRPVILLPLSFASGLTIEQVEMLLCHELAHIRRWDPFWNVVQRVIETFLFFHPAVWFISRRVRLEREICCDDLVLLSGGSPLSYAASLLDAAQHSLTPSTVASLASVGLEAAGRASHVRSRVLRLVGEKEEVRLRRPMLVLLPLVLGGLLVVMPFVGKADSDGKQTSPLTMSMESQKSNKTVDHPTGDAKTQVVVEPRLQVRFVAETEDAKGCERFPLIEPNPHDGDSLLLHPEILLSEKDVVSAEIGVNPPSDLYHVMVKLSEEGSKSFSDVTGMNLNKRIAIVFDQKIYSTPIIKSRIRGGLFIIASDFSKEEAFSVKQAIIPGKDITSQIVNEADVKPQPTMVYSATATGSLRIQVEDDAGHPIEGAQISPSGLSPKTNPSSMVGWSDAYGKPPVVTTDTQGYATLVYPLFMQPMKWEVGAVSIRIDHSDYCSENGEQTIGTPEKIFTLKKGATVIVSGYTGEGKNSVPDIYPQVTTRNWIGTESDLWKRQEDGRLVHKGIPPGQRYLRLVSLREDGFHLFSEVVAFTAEVGKTYDFHLEMKPGAQVEVKLDDNVPRPVKNGLVYVFATPTKQDPLAGLLLWQTWRNTKENGVAIFESLPYGDIEVIGICDGAVSKVADKDFGTPEVFSVSAGNNPIQIRMEPTATFKVKTVDEAGQPVEGVRISFWPNIRWCNGLISGGIQSRGYTQEELLRFGRGRGMSFTDLEERITTLFKGTTHSSGEVLIHNLPGFKQLYEAIHDEYEPKDPDDRTGPFPNIYADLTPGATTEAVITMKRKGSDPAQNSQKAPGMRNAGDLVPAPQPAPATATEDINAATPTRTGFIHGQVTDAEGNPLNGVIIQGVEHFGKPIARAKAFATCTDQGGYYSVDSEPGWPVLLDALWESPYSGQKANRIQVIYKNNILEESRTVNFKYDNVPTCSSGITGRLLDRFGNVITDYEILMSRVDMDETPVFVKHIPPNTYHLDYRIFPQSASGEFELKGIPSGKYNFFLFPRPIAKYIRNYTPIELSLSESEIRRISFEVPTKNTFFAKVKLADGSPVVIEPAPWEYARTYIHVPTGRCGAITDNGEVDRDGLATIFLSDDEITEVKSGRNKICIYRPDVKNIPRCVSIRIGNLTFNDLYQDPGSAKTVILPGPKEESTHSADKATEDSSSPSPTPTISNNNTTNPQTGSVHGRVMIGKVPQANQQISVEQYAGSPPGMVFPRFLTTDAEGYFHAENMPIGKYRFSRITAFTMLEGLDSNSPVTERFVIGPGYRAEVRPGESTEVKMGWGGRRVIGRLVSVPNAQGETFTPMSLQARYFTLQEERKDSLGGFTVVMDIQKDGSFELPDAIPGNYITHMEACDPSHAPYFRSVLSSPSHFTIPPSTPGHEDEPYDVGEIKIQLAN